MSPFSHTHSFRIPIARLLFSQIPEQGGAAAQWALLAKHLEEEANPFLPYFVPYIRHNSHFPHTRHASSPPPMHHKPVSPRYVTVPLFPLCASQSPIVSAEQLEEDEGALERMLSPLGSESWRAEFYSFGRSKPYTLAHKCALLRLFSTLLYKLRGEVELERPRSKIALIEENG